jgi:hypothetical protein
MKKLPVAAAVLSVLTACGNNFLHFGSTHAYADGYNDGCTNGSSTASNLTGQLTRNEARYNSEPDYASGWLNGNRECNGTNLRFNPNNPLEQVDVNSPLL